MTEREAVAELIAAVIYLGADGTQKLCGDRCSMHVETGEHKDSCTIHDPKLYIPNEASCGWYKKGPAPSGHLAMPMRPFVDPAVSGLILGKVQCKRCVRANHDASVCKALTEVLHTVYGLPKATFRIVPDACCNWNKAHGQRPAEERKLQEKGRFKI